MSPYRPGEKINIDEYYRYVFEHTKGLPETAAKEGLSALDYMKKYGAFTVSRTEQTPGRTHGKQMAGAT
jgi:hypothetical protein